MLAPPAIEGVPDTLVIGAQRYVLQSYLWRDFMPISPPNGDPLRAVVHLCEVDSLPVPEGLGLEHLWVVDSTRYWSTEFNAEAVPGVQPFQLARIARCGPKWDPEIRVDVIVSVRSGESEQYLRERGALIHSTE